MKIVFQKVSAGYWLGMDELRACVRIEFIQSDANSDSTISMSDAIHTLRYIYVPGSPEPPCMDAADANDSGEIMMSDAVYTLRYLFVGGAPQPPAPFPDCGVDPTPDELSCNEHPCMGGRQAVKRKLDSVR